LEEKVKVANILLVEDNAADIALTKKAIEKSKIVNNLSITRDGEEAMDFLYKKGKYSDAKKPDLIILDLNLPKKDGREILEEVKKDEDLKKIPVVILTTSNAEKDILKTYNLYANCYITKPLDFDQFIAIVKQINDFWFSIVKLPRDE